MVYVIGGAVTKIGNLWERSLRHLAVEVMDKALEDAGIERVDYVVVANSLSGVVNGQENLASYLLTHSGHTGLPALKVEAAGASGGAAILLASALISSGQADRVLVVGVEKLSDYTALEDLTSAYGALIHSEYEGFTGATLDSLHAMMMRTYMRKYGVERVDFSHLPILMHENASTVPHAQLRFKLKPEAYANAPTISDPITMLDLAPQGDGAAAVVLSKDPKGSNGSIALKSFGHATDTILSYRRTELTSLPAVRASLSKLGEVKPDYYSIHDYSSVMGYIIVEELGLAERGKAKEFFSSGEARRDGSIPINPEGGLKARGHPIGATGVYQVAEALFQLTERAEGWQVEGARRALLISSSELGDNVVSLYVEVV